MDVSAQTTQEPVGSQNTGKVQAPVSSSGGIRAKFKKISYFLGFLLLAVAFVALLWFVLSKPAKKAVPAIEVNGEKISKEFYNHRIEIQENFYKNISPDPEKLKTVRKDEADAIVNTILMKQALAKRQMLPSDEEINEFMKVTRERYEKSATASGSVSWEGVLQTKYLMSPDDKKYVDSRELMSQAIAKMQPQKHMLGIWLKRPGPGDGPKGDEFKVEDEAVLTKAQGILARIKSGEDFEETAGSLSEDPISKPNNGDLGFYPTEFKNDEIPKSTFASMAIVQTGYDKLGKDEVDLFEYPSGYAILKVVELKGDWPYKDLSDFLEKERAKATIKINIDLPK